MEENEGRKMKNSESEKETWAKTSKQKICGREEACVWGKKEKEEEKPLYVYALYLRREKEETRREGKQ